jgi:hypothetical protein
MPADTSAFVAGHYNVTYDGFDIGTTEVGFDKRITYYKEDIRIDDFGDAIVDGIFRGYNVRITAELSQWAAAGRELLQFVFDKEDAGVIGKIQFVGRTLQSFAKPLIMTPVADINVNNKIYTYPLAVPDGDHGGWSFNTKKRTVRVSLLALINITTGVVFTET